MNAGHPFGAAGGDAPATVREIFDALKQGGFVFGAKDDATAIVVLRAMLRKNTAQFYKLQNGKYGLRLWYPHVPKAKGTSNESDNEAEEDAQPEPVKKEAADKAAA